MSHEDGIALCESLFAKCLDDNPLMNNETHVRGSAIWIHFPRVFFSPMATYSAIDGLVQDFHLVHLGARALGGAALVFVEMTSPCPEGRITPACPGLYNDAQMQAFKRIIDFSHASGSGAKTGLQICHSGLKGSTQVGWEQADEPLATGNWPLIAASTVAFCPTYQTHSAVTRLRQC